TVATCAGFSPDGRWVLRQDLSWGGSGPPQGGAELRDAATMAQSHELGDWCTDVWFAPRGLTIAGHWVTDSIPPPRWFEEWLPKAVRHAPNLLQWVRVWDCDSGRELASFPDCSEFAYIPDGKRIATWREFPQTPPDPGDLESPIEAPRGAMAIWDI